MSLETITGNLRDACQQFKPGTIHCVDHLMKERRDNPELRNQWSYAADGVVYLLNGANEIPTLAMTREAYNPVLQNINNGAFEQLTREGNYHLAPADLEQALAASDTVLIDLLNLRLSEYDSEFSYLTIGTTPSKYGRLNDEERKFVERVYGKGDDFIQNMKMLENAKIIETRIYVLNPDYVRKQAQEGAIARASWLQVFFNNSDFNAGFYNINNHNCICGIRRSTREADTAQNQGSGS